MLCTSHVNMVSQFKSRFAGIPPLSLALFVSDIFVCVFNSTGSDTDSDTEDTKEVSLSSYTIKYTNESDDKMIACSDL